MVSAVIVVFNEAVDVCFEVSGQVVVLKQDAVLQGLMPALDLALGLRMMGRAAHVLHAVVVEPFCEICGDVTRPIVAQQTGLMNDASPIAA